MANVKTPIKGITQRPPVVDFIDKRLPKYHQAFENPPAHFDLNLQRYVPDSQANHSMHPEARLQSSRPPPPVVEAMKFWNTIFPEAMKELNKRSPKPAIPSTSPHSIRNTKGWEEVRERLVAARTTYEGPKGSVTGYLKRGFHKAGENTQLLRRPLDVVQNINHISPVVGAVQIVLDAAKEASQIRKEIEGLVDELGDDFVNIESFLGTFPGDRNIHDASVQLVAATFGAIEDVIGYYAKGKFVKAVGYVAKGDEYPRCLRASLAEMKSNSQKLIHQAEMSNMWQTRQVWETAASSSETILAGISLVLEQDQSVADTLNKLKSLFEEFTRNHDRSSRENQYLATQNAHLMAELIRARTPSPQPWPPPVSGFISQESLHALLKLDDFAAADMEFVWTRRPDIPAKDRQRAEGLVRLHQFRGWVVMPASQKLLVHGDLQGTSYVSGLSVLCSMLVRALKGVDRLLPVIFFCGRHMDEKDVNSGGRGMIKSLIAQILCQQSFDTRLLDSQIIQSASEGSINALCALFRSLACLLPEGVTLVCVIDGIKYYERDAFAQDMGVAVAQLLGLLRDPYLKSVVKLLVTSPLETRIVRQAFAGCILSMASIPWTEQSAGSSSLERELSVLSHENVNV